MHGDLGRAVPPVRACRDEQRRPRAALAAATERDPPEARDGDRQAAAVAQLAAEGPGVADARERVDPAAAEVPHEQVARVPAEARRREREAPRLVERAVAVDPRDEAPREVVLVDVAAVRRVVPVDGVRGRRTRRRSGRRRRRSRTARTTPGSTRRGRRRAGRAGASARRRRARRRCGSRLHRAGASRRAASRGVSPRKTAPVAPSSAATTASVDQPVGTVGDQPRIIPSSQA